LNVQGSPIKRRALSAVLWSAMDVLSRQAFQLIFSIVLARLLSPEDFGTIALLFLFTGIAGAFIDGGFVGAITQRQDVTLVDESTVFWFNLAMGGAMALALWSLGPLIAKFYDQPILVPLSGLFALNVFLGAIGSMQSTILNKTLQFRTLMKISVVTVLVSGLVGLSMAWLGYGLWSLAAQTLTGTVLNTILLWSLSSWRPAWTFSLLSAKKLFGFGGSLLAAALLEAGYSRAYTLLIGKLYGPHDLGIYSRADNTQMLPVGILTFVLNRVAFPLFSQVAHDKAQLQRGARMAIRGLMFLSVPMMLGLMVVAEPLISTLFGARWLPVVPVMQVLCLSGVLWPLNTINLNLLLSQGHSPLFLRLELVKKSIGIGLLVAGSYFGMMGIAWSQVILSALSFVLASQFTQRQIGYGTLAQVRDLLPSLLVSIPMVACVYWAGLEFQLKPAIALVTLSLLGALVYFGVAWACRLAILRDAIALLKRRGR